MNRLQYLLNKLAKEASEIAQISLKTSQFGPHEVMKGQDYTNAERINLEVNDLFGVISLLNDEFNLNIGFDSSLVDNKIEKVNRYYKYSVDLGMVDDR